ncbi:hypothetical protein [Roseovarius mucosus]|uniref:hypothetical protein n=1 Tax=Roseovarius mucosus TaxID=215743 RepID=UPI0035D06FAC
MLITKKEEVEGQLIRITDQMANLALLPLTGPRATELRHLAARVGELTATENVDGTSAEELNRPRPR